MAVTYNSNQTSLVGPLGTTSLGAGASTTFTIDVRTGDLCVVQIPVTFGTIAATAGLQFGVQLVTNGVADTDAVTIGVIAAVAGARKRSFRLPVGQYVGVLTNLDATNGVTLAQPVLDTVTSL